ncbi:MAG: hypothetical protein AAF411_05430 [Myxococcota bacterium]
MIPVAPLSGALTGADYVCPNGDREYIEFALSSPGVHRISLE